MNNTTIQEPLILIDGSSYLFRAYHALPPLITSTGMPTGAIYGMISMLRKLLKQYETAYIAVVFDPRGKTARHAIYPDYKANRVRMPQELSIQIEPLHKIIRTMGIPLVTVEGIEADDVIGVLAKQANKSGQPVLISTNDKDMAQLVNDKIMLINPVTNARLDKDGVFKKFGVLPSQIIDFLTLTGDNIDNIPGIPGVGPKTAAKWLLKYGSLEEIVLYSKDIKGKVGERLRSHQDTLSLTKRLVTIDCDMDLGIEWQSLRQSESDPIALNTLFKQLEFKSWLTTKNHPVNYSTLLTPDDFQAWIKKLKVSNGFAFDTETTSLDTMEAELVGISLAVQSSEAAYIPIAHCYEQVPDQLPKDKVLKQLKLILEDPRIKIIGHNLKYDMAILSKYNIQPNNMFDTMLASYTLNSVITRHNLNSLALYYLSQKTTAFETVVGKGKKQLTFDQVTLDKATHYAAEDADMTLQLYQLFEKRLAEEEIIMKVFSEIEMPLLSVLLAMEKRGVLIDIAMLQTQSHTLELAINALQEKIFGLAKIGQFNLNSPKQLQTILFDQLKLPIIKKTTSGQPSTAESVLQRLSLDYPLPRYILEYRRLTKLKSTYTDRLPEQVHSKTGRVHCSYNQAVTSTGRLSSTKPNLQNIPIRTNEGRQIRSTFIAPPGYKMVSADYSQIELRIMAYLSQDKRLIDAFAKGEDIHRATASEVFNTPAHCVTDDQRRHAKAINFGLIYGMSAFGLARQIQVDNATAQSYIDRYFDRYPNVLNYMKVIRQKAKAEGFVETLYGRRLYLTDINSQNVMKRQAAERVAINAPMQGSAADIIKLAMINIHHFLTDNSLDAHLIMQVHDELVFEIAEDSLDQIIPEIRHRMTKIKPIVQPFSTQDPSTDSIKQPVELLVDIGVGNNWAEAH